MKFKFIGNGDGDPDEITAYGVTFAKGKAAEVKDADAIAKLSANSHFSAVQPRKAAVSEPDDENHA